MPSSRPAFHCPETEFVSAFDHIVGYWPQLTGSGSSLALPLPGRFIKPGGAFQGLYYWDTYFTLLGLVVQGEWQLARESVDNLILAVEQVGHVPNYNEPASVCRSRSQPPFLTAAITEVYPHIGERAWLERATAAATAEYQGYWTAEPHLTPTGLSRYVDEAGDGCATGPDTPHHRALAESGWDNTPRFGPDATRVAPVDLNAQLYRYELDLARFHRLLGRPEAAQAWTRRARERRRRIQQLLWDQPSGFFRDLDLETGRPLEGTPRAVSAYVTLWAGLADRRQARRLVEHLPAFEQAHGLASCEPGWQDGTEHNYPAGWPYAHWYVAAGLRRYGYHEHACRIALKWLRLIARTHRRTGAVFERYNVVHPEAALPGRYPPQPGFAWTNGVFLALLARVVFGLEPDPESGQPLWRPQLPAAWRSAQASLTLPTYPPQYSPSEPVRRTLASGRTKRA